MKAAPLPLDIARQVQQARCGSQAAFAWLYRTFAPLVHAIHLGMTSRAQAEELRELVSALARELAIAQPRIALMGGLLAEENVYREAVCAALSGMAQPVRPLHLRG